jgi:hypothetical protein
MRGEKIMADNKVDQIKASVAKFTEELKKYNVDVKSWNVAVGKSEEGTTLKIAIEVAVKKK